jgi:hypothetical protein
LAKRGLVAAGVVLALLAVLVAAAALQAASSPGPSQRSIDEALLRRQLPLEVPIERNGINYVLTLDTEPLSRGQVTPSSYCLSIVEPNVAGSARCVASIEELLFVEQEGDVMTGGALIGYGLATADSTSFVLRFCDAPDVLGRLVHVPGSSQRLGYVEADIALAQHDGRFHYPIAVMLDDNGKPVRTGGLGSHTTLDCT